MASWLSSGSTFSRIRSIVTLTELGTDSHPSAGGPSSLFQKPSSCCSFIIYLSSVIGYFRSSAVTPTRSWKEVKFSLTTLSFPYGVYGTQKPWFLCCLIGEFFLRVLVVKVHLQAPSPGERSGKEMSSESSFMTPTPRKTCLLFFTLNIGSANINYNNLHLGPHGSCILLHNKPQDPAPVAWNQIFNASFTLQRGRFLQMVCLFPCSKHRLTYVVAKGSHVTRGQTPVSKSCLSTTELYLLLSNWTKGIIWRIPHPWHTHSHTEKKELLDFPWEKLQRIKESVYILLL